VDQIEALSIRLATFMCEGAKTLGQLSDDVVDGPVAWRRLAGRLRKFLGLAMHGGDRKRLTLQGQTLDGRLDGAGDDPACSTIPACLANKCRQSRKPILRNPTLSGSERNLCLRSNDTERHALFQMRSDRTEAS
jgi:hypothetical protein